MVEFAVKTPPQHADWADLLSVWRAADQIDVFAEAWNFDHFYPLSEPRDGPCLEAWTTLAALTQATERIRVGCMVNGMHYRDPAVTANMAASLDIISGAASTSGWGAAGTSWSRRRTGSSWARCASAWIASTRASTS